jgi:hypothetical protein
VRFSPPLAAGLSMSRWSGIVPADFKMVNDGGMMRHYDLQKHALFKLEFKRRPVGSRA